MKTRNGFVSNSSSASYIVKIQDTTLEEFANKFREEYYYGDYSLDEIREKLEEDLRLSKEELSKVTPDHVVNQKYYNDIIKIREDQLKELDVLDDSDSVAAMNFLLDYYHVKHEETKNGIALSYFTSMHNDYDEGMGTLLKEIVLFWSFEGRTRIICEVKHD